MFFAWCYLLIGFILLRPMWWRGPCDNPAFVVLFWPILVLMGIIFVLEDKRFKAQYDVKRRLNDKRNYTGSIL